MSPVLRSIALPTSPSTPIKHVPNHILLFLNSLSLVHFRVVAIWDDPSAVLYLISVFGGHGVHTGELWKCNECALPKHVKKLHFPITPYL